MDLGFTEEQENLRLEVRKFLNENPPGVKKGRTKRVSSLNLAIKVTGRDIEDKRARLKTELVSLSVGSRFTDH